MRTVRLPDGTEVPALGQGTWHMGERGPRRDGRSGGAETRHRTRHDADRHGRDVRQRRRRRRSSPKRRKASATSCSSSARCIRRTPRARGVPQACERSLKRLRTDRIDLYLLHWRGSHPLGRNGGGVRTAAGGRKDPLLGRIEFRHATTWQELVRLPDGANCATNQVLYHAGSRGIEYDLLPWIDRTQDPTDGVFAGGAGRPTAAIEGIDRGREATQCNAGADRHRLDHAPRQCDLDSQGEGSVPCAGECRRRRDRAQRRRPRGDRRSASATGAQAVARRLVGDSAAHFARPGGGMRCAFPPYRVILHA